MLVKLNFKAGKPAYLQIIEQIKFAAAMGEIAEGESLPSIRELAEQLRINRNTVAKAYGLLQSEGIVSSSQGKGVFLVKAQTPYKKNVRKAILGEIIDGLIVQAHHFQIDLSELIGLVEQRFEQFEKEKGMISPEVERRN
ncbi:GntR family transcriptional regulator [bacterium]|nr:GntR family transcriptional regulator [bacterium]